MSERAAFIDAVQRNCHIADARHAGDLPLCSYLLQMREFCRWSIGQAPGRPLPRETVGAWLAEREALWDGLEGEPLQPLPFEGRVHDPFDTAGLNAALAPHGLLYGAGLVGPGRPVFFVGERREIGWLDPASAALQACEGSAVSPESTAARALSLPQAADGDRPGAWLQLQVAGTEFARTLLAPPAALSGGDGDAPTIVLRLQSLERWLWEGFEAWSLRRSPGPYARLMALLGVHDEAGFAQAAPRLAASVRTMLVLHEIGEARCGGALGPRWPAMRRALRDDRLAEARLRALRDLLADGSVTLPRLLGLGDAAALHFWFAHYDGLREAMCPGLPQAYEAWCAGDGGAALRSACAAACDAFTREAEALHDMMAPQATQGESVAGAIARRLALTVVRCDGS